MSRKPEVIRPFSIEYHEATGRVVTRMMDGPMREYMDAGYVGWLEGELTKARNHSGGDR